MMRQLALLVLAAAAVPLTALVTGFIVLLALSLAYIDITNPIPNPFR